MKRNLYLFGIFFLGLYVIATLFQNLIFFQIDDHLFRLQSFANWFLVLGSTSLVITFVTLKYYYHKGFKFVFVTAIISLIAALFHHITFYFFNLLLVKEFQVYYIYAVVFTLIAEFLYAISLMFSKTGQILWLRTTGIFILIIVGISIYVLTISFNTLLGQSNSTVTELIQWLNLASGLVPVLLIFLFYDEMKSLKTNEKVSGHNKSSGILYFIEGIAVLMILVFGIKIGTQSYFKTHISAYTKSLAEPFEARTYRNSEGDTLLYRLLKPQDYNPSEQYPLVVCLHGGAGWGSDNYRQFDGSLFARLLSKPQNREKYPAFLFVPQCPRGATWGGLPNMPSVDSLVFEVIGALMNELPIDEGKIYVAGHSLGGYGTWYFIGTRPDKFAAAIPVAGEGDSDLALNMLGVSIWAFHGTNDKNVPVSGSRMMIEAIQKAGGNPRYTESPDGGHSWKIVEDTPGVLEWLFAQSRNK